MASAEAVKKGLRRKWQATVKQRSEPSSADAPVLNDEQQWNEQWQKLWRDIEGGEDWESLIEPISQHDKELSECGDLLLDSIQKILSPVELVSIRASSSAGATDAGNRKDEEEGEQDESKELVARLKQVKGPTQPLVVFSVYRDQVLNATRESFKILRRLHVSSARSLAKLVRAERGVTPDEWAKQRAFLINEHMKQIDTIREEAQVRVQEDKHKMDWSLKQERLEMQARMEDELAAAQQQAEEEREMLTRKIQAACDARVQSVQQELEIAMKRLAEGDFDLLKNLTLANEFIEMLKGQKEALNKTIESIEEQEAEHLKEIKRLKKDRQILSSSLDEAKKATRKAEQEKNKAERREQKLNEDLEILRKEYHFLEKKLLEETHELESLRKQCAKLTASLAEAEGKLPEIDMLKKRLLVLERQTKEADSLKEHMVRKCWVLENEVTQLQKDQSLLVSELDGLQVETAKQREGLVMGELVMKGVQLEVQRQVALAKQDQALHQARQILTQRSRQLRQEAKMPLHLIPKASVSFSSDSTSSEDAIRSRLLFRAAALELEAACISGNDNVPATKLLAEAQLAMDHAVCGEDEGTELPLRVIPYDFESSGKTRRNVRQIVDEIYDVDKAPPGAKLSDSSSQASVSGGASTDVSAREPTRIFSAQPGGEKTAKPDFTITRKESIDLHGGAPVHVVSGQRPQSALSVTRRRPPDPMSLGVKKVPDRGPGGASRRPASALGRFSSDFSGGGSIDVLHAGGEGPLARARGLEKSGTARMGKVIQGRPSSALALASERKRKEEEETHGAEETQEDPLQTLDSNSKASIYMLMRRTPDSMSRARERAVGRFLERAQHATVALPPKAHASSRKSLEGAQEWAAGAGSEAVLNARAAANTDAEAERQSKYASQMQAVRERAAGQRPKALDRFVATPEPRPKEAMGL